MRPQTQIIHSRRSLTKTRSCCSSRLLSLVMIFAIASMAVLMSAVSTYSAPPAAVEPIRWLLHGSGIAEITANDEASRLLDGTRPFLMIGRNVPAVPAGWNAIPFASFTSFRAIENALDRGTLAPHVKGIMYDNEKWKFTPEEEQRDPAHYEKLAADLVHQHSLLFLAAPAVDLVAVLAPESRNKRYEAYLRLGI